MSYEVGYHISFTNKPMQTIRKYLRDVGTHIVFVASTASNIETIPVRKMS